MGLVGLVTFQEDGTSYSEYSEDEIEPKLKYVRLGNDLKMILNKTSATCIAVHTKVVFYLASK